MRQAFNIAVVIVLALVVANRTMTRVQAHESGKVTCAQGSELVKAEALGRGFTEIGARSQGENFLSACLVSGYGEIGKIVAHD
ncbi:hypothetical protein [Paraburkholderia caballeronis]|uniref:Uncharacterized protein n=1 Tax=Paraburkholderia caballeronis TaxID=416943 RepID=A0A1H7MYV6_9BURK|nr:hypothetical protein [Paraburkholderia caballeronis]PXW26341.1 hypothetical protein C7403_104214 [Paraburkholderia caballeronis]PXX01888.1 hypothetical protein C7407_104214 [Paraburkholderia caballeronis]RAK01045.1 hypothetical protein C7409_104214 [Paraburkholderia caballeronis]TDV16377.1 hypothetical protein C7406_108239 [Paraburkholderia caballeronis]TDV20727.1 hypothetical protein C7408_101239 [Paraburkholderia caballeronis]